METTSINKVELQGFLGRDADVKTFDSGRTLLNISVATDESYKSASGEWVRTTTWHNVIYWKNKKDENFDFLKKGGVVSVTGKLSNRKYTDKNGHEKYITEIIAQKIEQVKTEKVH
jgi:single-strand DNA-binding protein